MLNERLAEIDRELSAFEVSEQKIEGVIAAARALRAELGALEALDATLEALGAGVTIAEPSAREVGASATVAEPGARATTWEEARRAALSELPSEGSGLLDVSDEALQSGELPAVLSVEGADASDDEREPISAATAAYIDPPSLPPTPTAITDDFSLDLDPEAGLVEPSAEPLSYVPAAKPTPSSPPRPSSAPRASTEDMLAELLDQESVEPPPPPPAPEPTPSVAEDEADAALAAMQAELPPASIDREANDAFAASLSDAGFDLGNVAVGEEEEVERTVMMKGSALLPPAPEAADDADGAPSSEFELDFDDEVIEIEEVSLDEGKSRPPPPPPRPPSDIPRSRPPEPPGQGFLSRLLKGNKS